MRPLADRVSEKTVTSMNVSCYKLHRVSHGRTLDQYLPLATAKPATVPVVADKSEGPRHSQGDKRLRGMRGFSAVTLSRMTFVTVITRSLVTMCRLPDENVRHMVFGYSTP